MELSNYLVSWVVSYLGDLQPTYIGVVIYLLSTMDIPVSPFKRAPYWGVKSAGRVPEKHPTAQPPENSSGARLINIDNKQIKSFSLGVCFQEKDGGKTEGLIN